MPRHIGEDIELTVGANIKFPAVGPGDTPGTVQNLPEPADPQDAATKNYVDTHGGGATEFTNLTDVPASYAGQGGKIVAVKGDVSGLEFIPAPSGGGGKVTMWLLPQDAVLPNSAFARPSKVSGTNGPYNILSVIADGTGPDEFGYWQVPMPSAYAGSNDFTVTVYAVSTTTTDGKKAHVHLNCRVKSNSEVWNDTFTNIISKDITIASGEEVGDLLVRSDTWDVSASVVPTAGSMLDFQVTVINAGSASNFDATPKDLQIVAIKIEEN